MNLVNPSSKRIAPTDNMRPKFHDGYTRHQWLKGYADIRGARSQLCHANLGGDRYFLCVRV